MEVQQALQDKETPAVMVWQAVVVPAVLDLTRLWCRLMMELMEAQDYKAQYLVLLHGTREAVGRDRINRREVYPVPVAQELGVMEVETIQWELMAQLIQAQAVAVVDIRLQALMVVQALLAL